MKQKFYIRIFILMFAILMIILTFNSCDNKPRETESATPAPTPTPTIPIYTKKPFDIVFPIDLFTPRPSWYPSVSPELESALESFNFNIERAEMIIIAEYDKTEKIEIQFDDNNKTVFYKDSFTIKQLISGIPLRSDVQIVNMKSYKDDELIFDSTVSYDKKQRYLLILHNLDKFMLDFLENSPSKDIYEGTYTATIYPLNELSQATFNGKKLSDILNNENITESWLIDYMMHCCGIMQVK